MSDSMFTIIGNLTADPEIRTTANGQTVANFTIAQSTRKYNRNTQQWEDGDTLYMRCSAWDSKYNPLASNIQTSLTKGMRVITQGKLIQRSYQDREGNNRTVVELRVDEIGPGLTHGSTQFSKNTHQEPNQANNPMPNGYQYGSFNNPSNDFGGDNNGNPEF